MTGFVDMHSHSHFSIDSKNTIELSCKQCIEKGYGGVAITDHLDTNPNEWGYGFYDPEKYFTTYHAMKRIYGSKIELLSGVEFSESHKYGEALKKISQYPYDVILGSVHWIDEGYIGNKEILNYMTQLEVEQRYFAAIKKVIAFGHIDVLAHLDITKRSFGSRIIDNSVMTDLLKDLVKSGIALEINTSALRQGLEQSLPEVELVEAFVDLGGKKITLGSDAHRAEDLTADFLSVYTSLSTRAQRCVGYVKQRKFVAYWDSTESSMLALLETYRNTWSMESDRIDRFIQFIRGQWENLKTEDRIGHLTGSAWIVNTKRDKVLLTHHRKLEQWFQLGGHTEAFETIEAAAQREAYEESGLSTLKLLSHEIYDIDDHIIPERSGQPAHTHFDIRFIFEADDTEQIRLSAESKEVKWVELNEVLSYSSDVSIERMLLKMKEIH